MDPQSLNCPNCGAALSPEPGRELVTCAYCHSAVRLPAAEPAAEPAAAPPPPEEEQAAIEQLLRQGQRIQAIKLHRQNHAGTLKESMQVVDAIGERIGLTPPKSSPWSCVGLLLAFFLWMALLALTPAAVAWLLPRILARPPAGDALETVQALAPMFLVVLTAVGVIFWTALKRRRQR